MIVKIAMNYSFQNVVTEVYRLRNFETITCFYADTKYGTQCKKSLIANFLRYTFKNQNTSKFI